MFKNTQIISFLIFVLFTGSIHATESVTLVFDESKSLQSSINVLVDSKALNFGQYDPNGFSYFVRVTAGTINLLGGSVNNVELSLTARAYADVKIFNGYFSFDTYRTLNITITGTLAINPTSPGFEIVFNDVSVQLDDENWPNWLPSYTDFVNAYLNIHTIDLPLVNLTNVFPDISLNYFADSIPRMVVTSDEIRLSLDVPHTTILANKAIGEPDYLGGTLSLYNHTTPEVNQLNKPSPTTVPVRLNEIYHAKTHDEILSGKKHNRWTNNINHKMETEKFEMNNELKSLGIIAYFDDRSSVTLTSNVAGIPMEFHDPWLVVNGVQPDEFRTITYGQYSIFLNQVSGDAPAVYSLRVPNVGKVTQSDIYVFDHWSVSPSGGADFQNPTARETAVVFKSAGATVTAVYVSANQEGKAVTIAAGESLTLPAGGSYTVANGNFGLVVRGTLNISGTADNPVTFAYADTNSNWGGIAVQAGGILNCEYANISRAGTGILVNHGAEATIKNSVFTDCYPAIESRSGIVSIENCLFKQVHDMVNAGFVYMQIATNVEEDYKIFNNTFVNNPNRAGINIEFDDFPIQSSLLNPADNPVNPVNLPPSGSRIFIFNNIFSGLGTGIYFSDSELHGHHVYIKNDCFYGNETDITPLAGIIISDTLRRNPLFVNPSSDNYHLQSTSPCIDAGNPTAAGDYYTPYDPDYTIKDIGAYYYDHIPAAPYLVSVTWVSSHPRLLWNRVADQDIQKYRVYKTYVNSSGSRTTTVDVELDTTYIDPEITYVNPRFANTTASYKVTALDNITQESAYSNTRSVSGNGPLWKAVAAMPTEFALHPAYPNPFNPVTQIRFDVPSACLLRIEIYDVLGRPVKSLATGNFRPGYYALEWDGRNDAGKHLSAGIYLIKMSAPGFQHLEKCMLVK